MRPVFGLSLVAQKVFAWINPKLGSSVCQPVSDFQWMRGREGRRMDGYEERFKCIVRLLTILGALISAESLRGGSTKAISHFPIESYVVSEASKDVRSMQKKMKMCRGSV